MGISVQGRSVFQEGGNQLQDPAELQEYLKQSSVNTAPPSVPMAAAIGVPMAGTTEMSTAGGAQSMPWAVPAPGQTPVAVAIPVGVPDDHHPSSVSFSATAC